MHLMLDTIQCCHILPLLRMNQLEGSVMNLCRYVSRIYLNWSTEFKLEIAYKSKDVLPPSQNNCLDLVKIWMYLVTKTCLDSSIF